MTSDDPDFVLCTCCGKSLPLGSLYYHLSIRIEAAFDGVIDADALLGRQTAANQLQAALDLAKYRSAESLQQDVTQVVTAQLCVSCKNAVLGLVFGASPIV
ncbi:MAG: hypothetical protein K1Y36_07455 [Blastocatellia bacterium]|nr:hypothetical protein [Blastocatellia bacterium]